MNCRKCGSRIREGQKFCIECGAAVAQPEQSTKKTVSQNHGEQKKEKLVTCYDVLEVNPTASDAMIHLAYHTLSKKYNPDTYLGDRDFAEYKIQMINKAYGILADPETRRKYDAYLKKHHTENNSSEDHPGSNNSPPKKNPKTKCCPYCGQSIEETTKKCLSCGTVLETEENQRKYQKKTKHTTNTKVSLILICLTIFTFLGAIGLFLGSDDSNAVNTDGGASSALVDDAASAQYGENTQEENTQEIVQDAVDNYLRESTPDNLKQISTLEKKMVEEYLIKLIGRDTASTINSYNEARAIRDNILTYKSVYSDAFAETSEDIQVIYDLFLNLVSQYFQRIKINQKYPFEITDVSSCNWKEFYITQRLEKSYSDNIMGAIQKEIDSYAQETTSDWVAYNVNYDSVWGALPGDEVCVIHAGELNPFPEAGVYKLLCFNSDSTISLRDSKGFVEDAPIVHLISDEQQLQADYESYKDMTADIDRLKQEIKEWRLEQLAQSSSTTVNESQTQTMNTAATIPAQKAIYTLEYINKTTGNIIEVLGSDIVYAGGHSGSNRFYHCNHPDVYFGYVPHNWDSPSLVGNEPISAIWVKGRASISSNLSADMNKESLDTAAWKTPNVKNVETDSYYSEIVGGTIFQYSIETDTGTIIYEWYLDTGNGLNSPASEVVIIPAKTESAQITSSASVSEKGYVIESSGGLKIRSGPSTSYEEVGRLAPLEAVTIIETTYSDNREWGRIDRGWVCMDYIALGTPPVVRQSSGDVVVGEYIDRLTGTRLAISKSATGDYLLNYTASGVTLENLPVLQADENSSTDITLLFSSDRYPQHDGYITFCVGGENQYSYNALVNGLDGTYGDYWLIEKIS